jgi:hypothetical protein
MRFSIVRSQHKNERSREQLSACLSVSYKHSPEWSVAAVKWTGAQES